MTSDERDLRVAKGLAEFHARRERGEAPRLDELRKQTGEDAWADLCDVLAAEAALDAVIEPLVPAPPPRSFGRSKLPGGLGRSRKR